MKIWLCTLLLAFSAAAHAEGQPSVLVKTAPMRKEAMTFKLSGYGTVFSDPGSMVNVSLPRSGQIVSMDLIAGQIVRRGATLLKFETDPNSANGYAQAESALEMARSSFESTKRLYARQLATFSQLAAAKKALKDAESTFRMQNKLGAGTPLEIVKSPFDGVVAGLSASPGDRLQAGKALLLLARLDALRARIGVQPEDAPRIKKGMSVRLFPVYDKTLKLTGVVSDIHGMIDPQTRLVDVIVDLGRVQNSGLIPGMKLRGEIEVRSASEWVVPRSAVLSDEQGAYIFQDDTGRARRIDVSATEGGALTAIQGKFDPALPVVVLGNYELQDGMKLRKEH
jgi:RND family efflux transporter MFP subunit